MNITKIAVTAGCILALCAGCGANDTSSTKEKASSDKSGVSKEIAASVDKMENMISELNESAEKADQKEIQKKGKELNSYWLSFENDIRSDYPFEYTEIEKHLQPIYTEAQKSKPDSDKIKTESESLKASLEDLTEAKKSSKRQAISWQKRQMNIKTTSKSRAISL